MNRTNFQNFLYLHTTWYLSYLIRKNNIKPLVARFRRAGLCRHRHVDKQPATIVPTTTFIESSFDFAIRISFSSIYAPVKVSL